MQGGALADRGWASQMKAAGLHIRDPQKRPGERRGYGEDEPGISIGKFGNAILPALKRAFGFVGEAV
jgi:hypothetical protein